MKQNFLIKLTQKKICFENLSKYITPNELKQFAKKQENVFFFILIFLHYHITELHNLLASTDIKFDVIGNTESKLNCNKKPLAIIDLPNYSIKHYPTGANGGALLFIKGDLIYKLRNDLKFFKSRELESIFIEKINSKNKNVIVGCIYLHPCMKLKEFNNDFMTYLSKKLLKEKNKHIILMGDFNADLLKYENDTDTTDFLDQIYASSLLPHITSPTLVSPRSKTLIHNIFSTDTNEEVTSGNILTSISDYVARFLLFPLSQTNRNKKKEIYKPSFKHFEAENFLNDVKNIDWDQALKNGKKLVDNPLANFLMYSSSF